MYNYIYNPDNLEEGHRFLRRRNLPRISLEKGENQGRLIASEDIQVEILKKNPTKEKPEGFIAGFYLRAQWDPIEVPGYLQTTEERILSN